MCQDQIWDFQDFTELYFPRFLAEKNIYTQDRKFCKFIFVLFEWDKKNWNVFRKIVNLLRGLGEKISGVGKSIKEIIPCSKIVLLKNEGGWSLLWYLSNTWI